MKINPKSAKTACGLNVIAYFLNSGYGMIRDKEELEPMTDDVDKVTCYRCKDAMK